MLNKAICDCRRATTCTIADASLELRRTEALLAAERDRGRILEAQLNEVESSRSAALTRIDVVSESERVAKARQEDAQRTAARAAAETRSAEGRQKVLEAQLAEAQAHAESLQRAEAAADSERKAAAGASSKESASLSSALRASRARCAGSLLVFCGMPVVKLSRMSMLVLQYTGGSSAVV
jgi:chromosome segregation ATPase